LDEITPKTALGIGLFQCLALWPGFSRSASTIMGGMLLGAKRTVAAEYSFIAAVPIMFAATGYDFLKNYALFESGDLIFLLIGFVVSFIAAWLAVKGFIVLLGRLTLRPFAVYRILLAVLILLFL
jgi:undecaprenyl-diphosphatase